jgi:hypothetical protein
MKVFLSVLVSGLFSSTVALSAPNACDFSSYKVCVESDSVDLSGECSSQGGTVLEACATENRIGTCAITQDSIILNVRYYEGTPINAEENCKENDGQYTRG